MREDATGINRTDHSFSVSSTEQSTKESSQIRRFLNRNAAHSLRFTDGINEKAKSRKIAVSEPPLQCLNSEKQPKTSLFQGFVWSGEQDLNLRQLGYCGLGRLE